MTADKLRAYAQSVDLSKLSAIRAARAIRELADKLEQTFAGRTAEGERGPVCSGWFEEMTEDEKGTFVE